MATLSHSESRRLYSWWWDSHISPKNSKWLQENLTDMDGKVKSMIKLIEEDADSFARRAEMYYKKRPELMKLVEEFYRAYRALAERYNHATGELRHAQRTIAEAFPDQEPLELAEDSPSKSFTQDGDPHTPEIKLPVRALFDAYDLLEDGRELTATDIRAINKSGTHSVDSEGEIRKRGSKHRHEGGVWKGLKQEREREESSHDKVLQMSNDNQNLKDKVLQEIKRAGKAESEVEDLKKAIANMQVEKETVLIQYQQCLEKLSDIEGELNNARKDSMRLDEKSTKAEIEVQTLKETLIQLEAEKIAALVKHKEYMEKISNLEVMISLIQEENKGLDKRAIKAEIEVQSLKDEIAKLDLENKAVLDQYKQCLVKISDLDSIIIAMEDAAKLLKKQAGRAEAEVSELKKALADINIDKEASAFKYKCCLETIHKLEKDLSRAEVDVKHLENEVLIGTAKLRAAEENRMLLELSNQSLRVEADNLVKKIAMKDQELSERQQELEKLQTRLQEEQLRYAQIEVTLQNLQNLNSQSQENQRGLELELKNVLQMLKDLEVCKKGLEEEIQQTRDDNHSLNKMNISSTVCVENMQSEIFSLREMKERLEKEVSQQMGLSKSLQQEILSLKEEIKGLNRSYEVLVEQVKASGLNPKCVEASLKSLQDENLRLRHTCENKRDEREILLKKLENMEELLKKNSVVESSLTGLSGELEGSHEKVKALEESCKFLHGEKAALVAEKTSLMYQLRTVTENMHRLLEKNAVLENSLSAAKVELEGLREKSKGLEEICQLLKNERSNLLTERGALVFKLENVERRLESLEKKFTRLEVQYADLEKEKEKETVQCEVEELKICLSVEKQERTSSKVESETRFAGLENQIHLLQEENRWKKNEFEEQLEKALKSQFEISILQKFMKDMEEKNYSLIVECQKHVEASKLAEKVISELESENLEQQVETELLLDEIERLRLDIYQVFRALETGPDCVPKGTVENDRTFVHHILGNIEYMKCSISKFEDDKQQLLVENSVLLTLLKQLESKGVEIESEKIWLEKEFEIMAEDFDMVKNEKDKILKMNIQLKSEVNEVHQHAAKLEAELGGLCVKQADLHKDYSALQAAYAQVNQDNKSLLKKFSDLKEEKCLADQQNDAAVLEFLATANQSAILRSFGTEKMIELKLILEELNRQHEVNYSLENEMSTLRQKLELQKAENLHLTDAVCKLEMEMRGIREYNVQLKKDMSCGKESLIQTEAKLLDTEIKLEAAENLNSALCKMVEKLKIDIQELLQARADQEKNMLELSENNASQKKEIESLHSVNAKLESELGLLHEEIEEIIIREHLLSSELQDKNDEIELWESEAAAFYFDLQVSSIHEGLIQNKMQELTRTCQSIENESASKTSENELMKKKICLMENEIGGLKSELYSYAPVIASLREDIAFIEDNALLQTKLKAAQNEEPEFLEVAAHPRTKMFEKILEDQSLINLQKLQTRIKAIGKLMQEMNKPVLLGRSNPDARQEPVMNEIEELKPHRCFGRDKHEHGRKKGCEHGDTPKLQKIKNKASVVWNGMLMKDIPLDQVSDSSLHGLRKRGHAGTDDQMLEFWETSEESKRDQTIGESLIMSCKMTERGMVYNQIENAKRKTETPSTDSDVEKELCVDSLEVSTRSTVSNQEVINRKIHDRLALNAHKLENLQVMVQNLRRILEMNQNSRKTKKVDIKTVREQLLEAEETVVYLVGLNMQLVKNIEESPIGDEMASPQLNDSKKAQRRKLTEQAQKESERIDRLQLELQKIQYILLKLEDEKNKGKSKFFKSKTVILRDFLYNGKKNSGKRKKSPLCGCLKPSTSRNGRSF